MKYPSIVFVLLSAFNIKAQYNQGLHAFSYLNAVNNARCAALGGRAFAIYDQDLCLSLDQPAVLSAANVKQLHSSFGLLPTGVRYGLLLTAFESKYGVFAPYVRYMNYGNFNQTDINGQSTGSFSALDYNIGSSYAYAPNPYFRMGAQINLLGSNLERYSAFALSFQLSAMIIHPNKLFVSSVGLRNGGLVIKDYTEQGQSSLPLDIYAAVSYKLAHAPFRFAVVGHSLNTPQNIWLDPNAKETYDPLTGDTIPIYVPTLGQKIANHLHFQLELVSKGAVQMRLGFDYNRRQQLKLEDFPGLAGFSFGTRLHAKRFDLDYAIQFYSKAGSVQSLGLSTDFNRLKKKI